MTNFSPARRSIAAAAATVVATGIALSSSPAAASLPMLDYPTIELSGTPTVGQNVEATLTYGGGVSGVSSVVRWGHIDGDTCVTGPSGDDYTPVASDEGKTVCIYVIGSASGYSDVAVMFNGFGTYRSGQLSLARVMQLSTRAPRVGVPVTASMTADDAPAGFARAWAWGTWDPSQEGCGFMLDARAMGATFVPTAAELGRQLCVRGTFTAPGYATEYRTFMFETATAGPAASAERPRMTVSDKSIRKGQTVTVRAYGMKPGQSYLIMIKGRTYSGKVDESGRVVQEISYPTNTKSSKKRYVRVIGWVGSKVTFNKSVKVTYKR